MSKDKLPLLKKDVVWHVGPRKRSRKRPDMSWEGPGLSVSEYPEAWIQIARLGGNPTWRLEPKTGHGVFLDALKLLPKQKINLTQAAIDAGLLREETRWKASWNEGDDEDEESQFSAIFRDRAKAEEEATDDSWSVEPVTIAVSTTALRSVWSEFFSGELSDVLAEPVAWQVLLEQGRPDLDGVWWEEDLDPDELSAPRGVIFLSRLKRWAWTRDDDSAGIQDDGDDFAGDEGEDEDGEDDEVYEEDDEDME